MQKQEQEAFYSITDKLLLAVLFLGFTSHDTKAKILLSHFQAAFWNIFSYFICLSSP